MTSSKYQNVMPAGYEDSDEVVRYYVTLYYSTHLTQIAVIRMKVIPWQALKRHAKI